ncbi:hypothetical protein LTR12_015637 [Friedmanniomyces endolithicus]|nr:hypothetical protein LTR12_015637 [Friedmanniomyces endolithicus]
MRYCHIQELVGVKKLAELLHDLPRQGGAILLYISAQNAGMLISRVSDQDSDLAIRFEAFELSPRNKAVYQEAGRLHRLFPGSAVDINLKVFAEMGLVGTIANTLAKLRHQAAPGMQPQARKAGTNMIGDGSIRPSRYSLHDQPSPPNQQSREIKTMLHLRHSNITRLVPVRLLIPV